MNNISTPLQHGAAQPPTARPSAAQPSGRAAGPRRLVVDAPTRMFHWLFALAFAGAYLTADGERWRALHITLGYTLAGLLAFRVLYGLFGPRPAGLGLLWRKVGAAPAWLRSVAQAASERSTAKIHWRQGLHLLMGLSVLALLVATIPLTLSGYGTYNDWGAALGGDWLEEVHEFLGNSFLAAVLLHIGLIATLSVLHRRNQALPMLTGRAPGPGPDLVKRNPVWLAGLLLALVVAFMGWQWRDAPNGLLPVQGAARSLADGDHDDED